MHKFNVSKPFTLGLELEIQIINKDSKDLVGLSEEILKEFPPEPFQAQIKPEVTTSMLEINSSIHESAQTLLVELHEIKNQLLKKTQHLNILLSGGGTHPFQLWNEQALSATQHYQAVEQDYGYLTKMNTVFGMHIHIGCDSPNNALYLTHAMQQYIPHFIALSASSPFCQGIDTQFCSARSNIANLFPVSGSPPLIFEWSEFTHYLDVVGEFPLMANVNSFFWDIRPKAEFGTIEIRVFDTPLSIEKAVQIAAFVQTLAYYLIAKKPQSLSHDKYALQRYNRFQASKLGFDASIVDTETLQAYPLADDILKVFKMIEPHSKVLGNEKFMSSLTADVMARKNDAAWLKKLFAEGKDLKAIVACAGDLFGAD